VSRVDRLTINLEHNNFKFCVHVPLLCLGAREAKFVDGRRAFRDTVEEIFVSQLDWSGDGMENMPKTPLLVPVMGSNEELNNMGIELRNRILHPLGRIQGRGQFDTWKGIPDAGDGPGQRGDGILVVQKCLTWRSMLCPMRKVVRLADESLPRTETSWRPRPRQRIRGGAEPGHPKHSRSV